VKTTKLSKSDRQAAERGRTAAVLKRLTYTGFKRPDDPRVRASELASATKSELGGNRLDGLLKNRSGKTWPNAQSAWAFGESLRSLGIPWCSGLWMLWATGHLDDAVGVVVTWLTKSPSRPDLVDDTWHALALGGRLAKTVNLDREIHFARLHLANDRLTPEAYDDVWMRCAELEERPDQIRSYIGFVERELAKTPWLAVIHAAPEISKAYDAWMTAGRTLSGTLPLDRLAQATLAVASSDIPLHDRETAVLVMLAQWLTGIEHQTQMPLYFRPISPGYEVEVPEDFGSVTTPMQHAN
jgi:hypothetical protein